jgi:hypothetical protein
METTNLTMGTISKVKGQINQVKNNSNFVINSMIPKFNFKNKKGEIINYN